MTEAVFREAACPACGHHIAAPFFNGGDQPLATLNWPRSAAAAQALPRFPLDFVRCVGCGHVFNVAFDYKNVPYSNEPNLMFNRARNWSRFLDDVRRTILAKLSERPVVVEIGHGDGTFLKGLAEACPTGRFVGFDPNGAAQGDDRVEFRAELFDAVHHLADLNPHLIVSRHVLEHLANPLGFLQGISFAASYLNLSPLAYFEVPCIDRALASGRTVDFYYEHSSQFTSASFSQMLSRSAAEVLEMGHGYDGEVVFGFIQLGASHSALEFAKLSRQFSADATTAKQTIADQLSKLHKAGKRVAVWGGTGKSAAFICRHGVDKGRFPVVVDSDATKVGTFVPGTGQVIRHPDFLVKNPVDVVIVPPQWRAVDICLEMSQAGIAPQSVLIEHKGRLIDFNRDAHPYRQG